MKFELKRTTAALINGSFSFSWGIGCILFGKVILTKYGHRRKLVLLCGCIMQQVLLIVIYVFDGNVHEIWIIALSTISGLGSGSWCVFMNVVRDYNASYGGQDIATALINGFMFVGAVIVQLTIAVLLDESKARNGNENYSVDDYEFAFLVVPVFGILTVLLTLVIRETYGEPVVYPRKENGTDHEVEMEAGKQTND